MNEKHLKEDKVMNLFRPIKVDRNGDIPIEVHVQEDDKYILDLK